METSKWRKLTEKQGTFQKIWSPSIKVHAIEHNGIKVLKVSKKKIFLFFRWIFSIFWIHTANARKQCIKHEIWLNIDRSKSRDSGLKIMRSTFKFMKKMSVQLIHDVKLPSVLLFQTQNIEITFFNNITHYTLLTWRNQ